MTQIASPLKSGAKAPDFQTTIQDGTNRSSADYAGKKYAVYFYPRDMTPGCTAQACNLTVCGYTKTQGAPDDPGPHGQDFRQRRRDEVGR